MNQLEVEAIKGVLEEFLSVDPASEARFVITNKSMLDLERGLVASISRVAPEFQMARLAEIRAGARRRRVLLVEAALRQGDVVNFGQERYAVLTEKSVRRCFKDGILDPGTY